MIVSTQFITAVEVARRMGVGMRTVLRWCDAGTLQCHKTAGGHRRILRESFLALARLHGVAVPDAPERHVEVEVIPGEVSVDMVRRLANHLMKAPLAAANTQALGRWLLDAERLTEEAHRFIATSVR